MALCRGCRTPIPCHCHVTPAVEIRPGVYQTVATLDASGRVCTCPARTRFPARHSGTCDLVGEAS